MPLTEDRRVQLDSIVQQMVTNKESDDNIQLVVNDFKSKYEGQQVAPDLAQQREEMANIPAQTPEQEVGAMPAQTPEEIEANKQAAMRFLWPGAQTAKEHFIKGMTPALEMAGAVAGAPAGPYGSALGFGAGGAAGRGIEAATGLREPETAVGAMARTARDVGIGMLPMGIAKISKIPGAIEKTIKTGISKGAKVEKVIEKIGGKMLPSAAGESGLKGAQGTLKEVGKVGDELYETAKSLAPKDAKLSMNKTYDTIDRILKDESLNESEKQIARDALERISLSVRTGSRGRFSLTEGEAKHIKEAAPEKWIGEAGTITKPISFEEAYTLRRDLSKITKSGGTKAHVAGDILDTLHEDLAENVSKIGIPKISPVRPGIDIKWTGDANMFVAYDGTKEVGWYQVNPSKIGGFRGETITVHPSYKGQGIGTELVNKAKEKFGERLGGTEPTQAGKGFLEAIGEVPGEKFMANLKKEKSVTEAFQDAINYWRGTVVPQRTIVKTLEKKSLEKIPDLLNVDIKTVDALKKSMPKESFQDVKRGWLTKISDKAENNPMKIQKSIRDMLAKNKEPMEHAFSAEELSALKLVGEPGKFMAFLEQHPRTKWILEHMVRYGTYGAATGATTLGLAKIFGWGK